MMRKLPAFYAMTRAYPFLNRITEMLYLFVFTQFGFALPRELL